MATSYSPTYLLGLYHLLSTLSVRLIQPFRITAVSSTFLYDGLRPFALFVLHDSCRAHAGSAIVAFCLSRRTAYEDLSFRSGWKNLSYARLAIILVFCDSLLFLVLSGILIHGIGLERNITTCSLGIFACIFLYTSSKILIYSFLCKSSFPEVIPCDHPSFVRILGHLTRSHSHSAERVWLVWSHDAPTLNPRRLSSPVYRVCAISIVAYMICIPLLVLFRTAKLDPVTGVCHIGLQKAGTMLVLMYDV